MDNPFEEDTAFDDVNLASRGDVFNDPSIQGQLNADNSDLMLEEQVIGSVDGVINTEEEVRSPMIGGNNHNNNNNSEGNSQVKGNGFLGSIFGRCCGFLSVDYYRPYFNVDTEDVRVRLSRVGMPWKKDFFEVLDQRPDFYGPFWTCATLVFLIAASQNFKLYVKAISNESGTDEFKHNFQALSSATSFVYGFAIAMPFAAWACFSYFGVSTANVKFSELACIYGYSIVPFLPACILCAIPFDAINWLSVIGALAASSLFLVRSLWERLGTNEGEYLPPMAPGADENAESNPLVTEQPSRKVAALFLFGMLGLHLTFALILKFYFFGI